MKNLIYKCINITLFFIISSTIFADQPPPAPVGLTFYSLNGLQSELAIDTGVTKKFNPFMVVESALDNNYTNNPLTNKKDKNGNGNDFTWYQINPPCFDFDDPMTASGCVSNNIAPVTMTTGHGTEIIRNIYLRLRDAARNWSNHDPSNNQSIYATFIVDSTPPRKNITGK